MIRMQEEIINIPARQHTVTRYYCSACNLSFGDNSDQATNHEISVHIKKADIPKIGTAYFLESRESGLLLLNYYRDVQLLDIDDDKVEIIPGAWHAFFTGEQRFRGEFYDMSWIAPLRDFIPYYEGIIAGHEQGIRSAQAIINDINSLIDQEQKT